MKQMTRRRFMQQAALGLGGLALSGIGAKAMAKKDKRKQPNIIVILADDMGYSDAGCYGSEINTPNLDALAAGGIRFSNMYNCARCCPTRASLLTGLYPSQSGVGYMAKDMGIDGYEGYIKPEVPTIAEALKKEGYVTGISGKWHVGSDAPHLPHVRGFDEVFSMVSGACSYWGDGGRWYRDSQRIKPKQPFYATDAFSDEAVDFIGRHSDNEKPFFLYLAYTAPHWPLHAHQKDIEKYRKHYLNGWDEMHDKRVERMKQMGVMDSKWNPSPFENDTTPWRLTDVRDWENVEDKEEAAYRMAVYAAMVDCMDQGIGRVRVELSRKGIEDDTLIVFLSDNGACAEVVEKSKKGKKTGEPGSFVSYGLEWASACNTPLRRYKRFAYEGGIATPMIVSWPKVIKQGGGWSDTICHVVDILPTCMDVAGSTSTPTTEGRSLFPTLCGEKDRGHQQLCWEHEGHNAIREGKWKLVFDEPTKPELFDLEADRTETTNLSASHPKLVKELLQKHAQWARRTDMVPFWHLPNNTEK